MSPIVNRRIREVSETIFMDAVTERTIYVAPEDMLPDDEIVIGSDKQMDDLRRSHPEELEEYYPDDVVKPLPPRLPTPNEFIKQGAKAVILFLKDTPLEADMLALYHEAELRRAAGSRKTVLAELEAAQDALLEPAET